MRCTMTSDGLVGLGNTRMSPTCRRLTPTCSVTTIDPTGMTGTMLPVITCSK